MQKLLSLFDNADVPEESLIDFLPESFKALYPLIPLRDILTIIDTIGGRQLSIPKMNDRDSFIGRLIGEHLAGELIKLYGGQFISVPKAHTLKRHLNKIIMAKLHENGLTYGDIAAQFNITERSVYNILLMCKKPSET